MSGHILYYWPVPFRGQFIRAVLAHAGAGWTEPDAEAVSAMMTQAPADQPVPFMAPPMLVDDAGVAVAQMSSILFHLGTRFDLMPCDAGRAALTTKIVNDTNDVLDGITRNGGQTMWTAPDWAAYRPRLERWMAIWEDTGDRHGLTADAGHLLGGTSPGLADLVTATLWFTMADKVPGIDSLLQAGAPKVRALSRRLMATDPLARLRARTDAAYGDIYCGGQIEASLRHVLA